MEYCGESIITEIQVDVLVINYKSYYTFLYRVFKFYNVSKININNNSVTHFVAFDEI